MIALYEAAGLIIDSSRYWAKFMFGTVFNNRLSISHSWKSSGRYVGLVILSISLSHHFIALRRTKENFHYSVSFLPSCTSLSFSQWSLSGKFERSVQKINDFIENYSNPITVTGSTNAQHVIKSSILPQVSLTMTLLILKSPKILYNLTAQECLCSEGNLTS